MEKSFAPKEDKSPTVADIAVDFGKAVVQGGVINPLWNGAGQLVSGGRLPEVSIINEENAKKSTADAWAQKIGGAVGMAVDLAIMSKLKTRLVGEAKVANTMTLGERSWVQAKEGAKLGAAYGFVFTPSSPDENLILGRTKNAITNGITFGAMSGMASAVGGAKVFNSFKAGTVSGAVKNTAIMGGVGFPAGAIGAEADSLINHQKLAKWDDVKSQSIDFGVIGFTLSGLTHGASGLSALRSQRARSESTAPSVSEISTVANSESQSGNINEVVRTPALVRATMPAPVRADIEPVKSTSGDATSVAPKESPVISSETRDSLAGRITKTVLADGTTIDKHHFPEITITTKPDGTVITDSINGLRTEFPDGTETNITSWRTETRDTEGNWTFKYNKWAEAYENWENLSRQEKHDALATLDQNPRRGNLIENLVEKGLAEPHPEIKELALNQIKNIPDAHDQLNQWLLAMYHPENTPKLIRMIPDMLPETQAQLLNGRGLGIQELIDGMTANNSEKGIADPSAKAMNDYIDAVASLPKTARKQIWDSLGIENDGSLSKPKLEPIARQVVTSLQSLEPNYITAFGEFDSLIRPKFNPLDRIEPQDVSRRDLKTNSLESVNAKLDEFKAILDRSGPDGLLAPGAVRKAELFIENNKNIDLQRKIYEWSRTEHEAIRQFIDWKFNDVNRSVALTNEFIDLAKSDVEDPYALSEIIRSPFKLKDRANEYYVTYEQQLATLQNSVQLLQIADGNRSTRGNLLRSGEQFRMAGLQSMAQAADPYLITQGAHPTCAITQLEFSTYLKHPDEATRLINEVMRTGKFVTQDGSVIKISAQSLRPENNSLQMNKTMFEHPQDPSYRSYASQVFQMTAANIFWQRQTESPHSGRQVPKGSLRYEIKFEDILDEHGNKVGVEPKDYLMDYSRRPAEVVSECPYVFDFAVLEDIGRQIGGERTKPNVVNDFSRSEKAFEKWIKNLPYPEAFPLIVPIDATAMMEGTKFNQTDHAVSIIAPWQLGDRIYFRNTWFPGERITDSMPRRRFWELAGRWHTV